MKKRKHTVEVIKHGLEMDESLEMHETGWKFQRAGWVFILLVMVAGLVGLFGEGILSKQSAQTGNFKTQYEKYYRYETEMKVRVESDTGHINTISLPQDYLKNFELVRFVPEPVDYTTNANDVVYHFPASHNRIISIYLKPKEIGNISGDVKINGTNNIQLSHFIYP